MRIIAKKTLVEYYKKHGAARASLEAWYAEVVEQDWNMPAELNKRLRGFTEMNLLRGFSLRYTARCMFY
ncbi:hypothetical protein DU508_10010 [Pedobacter chinensis]|uniref:Uncharacterized protein n=1 Tax=Pedobacter chinensis TaxID=2282421 RepID=A0A369PYB1_9SPHI|nr:hypothetical protein [Pedobacter chinensis]RDC57474.1 hypothetical protein DU508_10010 [Pedobacter chinensis]